MTSGDGDTVTVRQQAIAGLNYAFCSFCIMFANKFVLTSYKFPSFLFLAISQFVSSIIALAIGNHFKIISFPPLSMEIFWKVFPLPFLFMLNTLTGLGGTKLISIPMFTVLRRFSILFTMILEGYYLGYQSSPKVKLSVFMMLLGAIVAAYDDLVFDMAGYTYIMVNNIATALNGVVMKKKLDSKDLGTFGLMYYNSLFSLPILIVYFMFQGEWEGVRNFDQWFNFGFLTCFLCASMMGFVLNFSIFHCTKVNSALTTTVI
eukprot:Ihof_evm3s393 gene=Ihof_evmTU3s393